MNCDISILASNMRSYPCDWTTKGPDKFLWEKSSMHSTTVETRAQADTYKGEAVSARCDETRVLDTMMIPRPFRRSPKRRPLTKRVSRRETIGNHHGALHALAPPSIGALRAALKGRRSEPIAQILRSFGLWVSGLVVHALDPTIPNPAQKSQAPVRLHYAPRLLK